MERKRVAALFVCLGLILAAGAFGLTFFLFQGLNSGHFFDDVDIGLASIPFSIAVPVYLLFAFLDQYIYKEKTPSFFPLAPKEKGDIRVAFYTSISGFLISLVFFFIFHNSLGPGILAVINLLGSAPALLILFGYNAYIHFKASNKREGIILAIMAMVTLAATISLIYGLLLPENRFGFVYIFYPLLSASALLIDRKGWDLE